MHYEVKILLNQGVTETSTEFFEKLMVGNSEKIGAHGTVLIQFLPVNPQAEERVLDNVICKVGGLEPPENKIPQVGYVTVI